MTRIEFLADKGRICGFTVSGHSSFDCEDTEGKTVCASVSSAVYMTANTLTDIIGEDCDIELDDGYFSLKLKAESKKESTKAVLDGLKLHLAELSKQYPERIKIITEV